VDVFAGAKIRVLALIKDKIVFYLTLAIRRVVRRRCGARDLFLLYKTLFTMNKAFTDCLWKNFGAAIDMLTNIVVLCPDDLWNRDPKVFYLAYHTVIFLDYYLTYPARDFRPELPYTLGDMDHLPPGAVDDVLPDRLYTKEEVVHYLSSIREKCRRAILTASEEKLAARWIDEDEVEMHGLCASLVTDYSVLEILFYNFRHVQHHVGQLNLLLRERAGVAANWISQAG